MAMYLTTVKSSDDKFNSICPELKNLVLLFSDEVLMVSNVFYGYVIVIFGYVIAYSL